MAFFTSGEAAELAKDTVRCAVLVDFEFTGNTVRLWNGFGTRTFGGQAYRGFGDLGQIDGLEETRAGTSQQVTFTLSAVDDAPDDLLAIALSETDLVQGNRAVVSMQLFDADWQVIEDPFPVYFGIMQPPRVTREEATEEGGGQRILTLPTENLFFGRSRPPAGRYTDREQQARFPGDKSCEYTPQMVNLQITWPSF